MKRGNLCLHAGVSFLALSLVGTAAGQEAPAPKAGQPEAQGQDGKSKIDVVVVTATKREESLQEVPLSITALAGDQLGDRGVQGFAEVARLVPGVLQSGSSQFSKFTVRGIQTSNTTSSTGEQKTVAVYLDDVPLTSFSILTPEISPYDMSRIEVLRGPQGTLFGSGTLAGAVRYITNRPNANAFDASVESDLGDSEGDSYRRRIAGMVNVPLADEKAAVRIVAYDRDEDGYIYNAIRKKDHPDSASANGVRVSVKMDPTDNLSLTAMYTDDKGRMDDNSRYNPKYGVNVADSRIPSTTDLDVKTYNFTASYSLPWAVVQSSTSLANVKNRWQIDLNAQTTAPVYYKEKVNSDTFIQDLRIVSQGEGPFEYVLGTFYMNQKSDYLGTNFTDPTVVASKNIRGLLIDDEGDTVSLKNDRLRRNLEAALYGEATWHFTDTLSATVGLRQSQVKYDDLDTGRGFDGQASYVATVAGGGNATVVLKPATSIRISTGEQKKLTRKFNLSWQPTEDQNYYFLASEGFRRGHPNFTALLNGGKSTVDPTDPTVIPVTAAPDTLWNYEVGAKTFWFDKRLRANVALYYIPWDNMQVNLVRPTDGQPFVGNAGKSISKGIELELAAKPIRSLELGANITLQDSKIDSLSAQEALASGAVQGAKLASPSFQMFVYGQQDFDLGDGSTAFARVDVQHVGDYPNGFPNAPGAARANPNYFINPAYTNVNFSVGWEKGRVRIIGYVENLLNDDDPIYINASGSTPNRYVTLRPRTIGIRTSLHY